MADVGPLRDREPVASPVLKKGFDLSLVDGRFGCVHEPILVKDSCIVKEQITRRMRHPHPVPEKSISRVVAANLKYWMGQAEMSQTALAVKAGVSQKTISNYLNPEQRAESSTGKPPSPKLEELDKIAKALAIPVWQLVREMTEKERRLYEHIERAYSELAAPAVPSPGLDAPTARRAKGSVAPAQQEPQEATGNIGRSARVSKSR